MQHTGGRLDDVLGRLADTGEAVVARHGKVLVAAAAVLQLKHLAGDDRVLLGHTASREGEGGVGEEQSDMERKR